MVRVWLKEMRAVPPLREVNPHIKKEELELGSVLKAQAAAPLCSAPIELCVTEIKAHPPHPHLLEKPRSGDKEECSTVRERLTNKCRISEAK